MKVGSEQSHEKDVLDGDLGKGVECLCWENSEDGPG